MLLLQIEVNKGKMPYLSASFTLKAKWLQFTQGVWGGVYGVHFLSNIFWISFSSDNFWPMYGNPGCKYFITVSVANSKFQCLFAIFLLNLLQHKGSLEKGVVLYTEIFFDGTLSHPFPMLTHLKSKNFIFLLQTGWIWSTVPFIKKKNGIKFFSSFRFLKFL